MTFPFSDDVRISELYDYWSGLRTSRNPPSIRDFDPIDVAALLKNIWMARWEPDVQDFVYRLAGENVLSANRRPMRHMALTEIFDAPIAAMLRTRYQQVCATPAIYHIRGMIYVRLERYGAGERLILPMLDIHGQPTMVLGCTIYGAGSWHTEGRRSAMNSEPSVAVLLSLDGQPLPQDQVKAAG